MRQHVMLRNAPGNPGDETLPLSLAEGDFVISGAGKNKAIEVFQIASEGSSKAIGNVMEIAYVDVYAETI